ncbi:MAG TPA: hypothetical protein VMR62_05250 [Bryobacteraceae bacterium]|jgi:hypothetical protein|nr:hypothetical protein [Bryobacteraceae bacterium]
MKRNVMFVLTAALSSAVLFAQAPKSTRWNGSGNTFEGPAQEVPAALQKIFSNLGASTTAAYTGAGFYVSGPASALGGQQFVGLPFKPTADAHVTQLRAAIQYDGNGANRVRLSLYSDNSGVPGTLMAGPVTVKNLPDFYACCKLAMATIPSTAVTKGVQYWVVADTPATGPGDDFLGVWAWIPPSKQNVGINDGSSWGAFPADIEESAGAVYGSIP